MSHQPSKSNERLVLDTTNEILALIPHIDGFNHSNINHKVDELVRQAINNAKDAEREKAVEGERERIYNALFDYKDTANISGTDFEQGYNAGVDTFLKFLGEKGRLLSVAITEAQTAQMWAVKGITYKF